MNSTPASVQVDSELALQAWTALEQASSIGIISHRHPDPDCIGSNISLREILLKMGKKVDSLCLNEPPPSCRGLKDVNVFKTGFPADSYDLLICLDCGSKSQIGFDLPDLSSRPFLINIDHHTSNDHYGDLNLVYDTYSSTCEIIFRLMEIWEKPVSRDIATALLMGIYFDTGSFMHSNVSEKLLEIAGKLTAAGADLKLIKSDLFQNFSLPKYHLWGQTLENIKITPQGSAVAVVTPEHLSSCQACPDDLGGLIDYVCMAHNSKFAVVINQEKPDQIRGSLRTREDNVDVFQIARKLGGGGHKKASGFGFTARIEQQIIWKITN
jgi:phosphoesterase RecJ-like protein